MPLSLTVIVFIGNLLLHLLFMWAYHKFKIIRDILPSFKSPNPDMKPCYIITLDWNKPDEVEQKIKLSKDLEDQFQIYHQMGNQLISFKEALRIMGKATPSRSQSSHSIHSPQHTTDVHASSQNLTNHAETTV